MTIVENAPTVDTGTTASTGDDDALKRVHHHCTVADMPRAMAGEVVRSLCGYMKRRGPNPNALPCCPICTEILHAQGLACLTRPR